MSRREDIDNSCWTTDLLRYSADAKLIAVWSTTNEHCNMAGLYRVDAAVIRFELGLSPRRLEKGLEELQKEGWLRFERGLLWVPHRVSQIRSTNPNVARAIAKDVRQFLSHPWGMEFIERYGDAKWLRDELRSGEPNPETVVRRLPNRSETHSG